MAGKKWTTEENKLLIDNYQLSKQELLRLFPDRTAASVNIQASKLGLRKQRNEYCQSDLSVLLEDNQLSYYWIGFLLADGHFTQTRLLVTLCKKDKPHLEKLAKFLSIPTVKNIFQRVVNKKYPCCIIRPQDKFYVPRIKQKFNIQNNKTVSPPASSILPTDSKLLLSLFIGFIDGDGSINKQPGARKTSIIRIQIHANWLSFLLEIYSRLNLTCAKPYINNRGYAQWNICNKELQQKLRKHILNYQLPVLRRKWDNL